MATTKSDTAPKPTGIENRELMRKLSDSELMERGEQLATSVEASEKIREQKRAALRGFNVQLKAEEEIQTKLCRAIDKGEEPRNVQCEWHDDENKPERYLTRTDTGEEVFRRALDHHELQQSMFATAASSASTSSGDVEGSDDDDFNDDAFDGDDIGASDEDGDAAGAH